MVKIILLLFTSTIIALPKLGDPIAITQYQQRYGEDIISSEINTNYSNVYANYSERLVLYYTNLYRINPGMLKNEDENTKYSACATWGDCYPAQKPLWFNLNLSRSARYHSDDMRSNGDCFEHTDCCVLTNSCPTGEDGSFANRIRKFYTGSSFGENIAAGHPYDKVVKNLINEVGATAGTDGHRHNIFGYQFNQNDPDFLNNGVPISYNEVGIGNLEGGAYNRYVTQNFGNAATRTEGFVVGIHEPQHPSFNKETLFNVIFHNAAAPQSVYLIIDDLIYKMALIHQNPRSFKNIPLNWFTGNYQTTINFPKAGCIPYHFQLIDTQGVKHKYPDVGELMAGSSCQEDIYTAEDPSIDITTINTDACVQNRCNEPHKTICALTTTGTSCSCESGYKLTNNECKEITLPDGGSAVSNSSGFCNFGRGDSSAAGVILLMMLLLFHLRKKIQL